MIAQDLIDFEEEIAEIYKTGVICGPIHLRGGNEEQLINIFDNHIDKEDIVFATWANHLEALLHGIPKNKVKERILAGHSMAMNFPEYNFYTSAIVGGVCSIAVGMAWALKELKEKNKVVVFLGDMALFNGVAQESIRYSINFDLPVLWVIGDNNLSVDTPTDKAWNESARIISRNLMKEIKDMCDYCNMLYYSYKNKWPHSGVGAFISF